MFLGKEAGRSQEHDDDRRWSTRIRRLSRLGKRQIGLDTDVTGRRVHHLQFSSRQVPCTNAANSVHHARSHPLHPRGATLSSSTPTTTPHPFSPMTHIPEDVALARPVEKTHPDSLPDAKDPNDIVAALQKLLNKSEEEDDVRKSIHAPMHQLWHIPFIDKLIPGLEKLANQYHVGNFVIVRGTGEKIFESMPIYPR